MPFLSAVPDLDLAAFLRAVPDGLVTAAPDGTITMVNEAFCRMTGFSRDALIGDRPPYRFWPEEDAEAMQLALRAAVEGGRDRFEVRFCHADGRRFPVSLSTARFHRDGTPAGFVAVVRDVTREVREREVLRATRDYERAVTASMGEGLYTVDEDGRLLYLNPAAERMLGWTHEELLGRRMHDVIHFRGTDGTRVAWHECAIFPQTPGGGTVRLEDEVFIRKDGRELPVSATSAPFDGEDGMRRFVVVFSDITDRKTQEQKMRLQMESATWIGRIREALAEDRFVLHAQPIIELAGGDTVQHELLIRMVDRDGAIVPPGSFLPAAEEHGLIADIDRWVIGQAAGLAAQGHRLEINLSAHSIGVPGLAGTFLEAFKLAGADPSLVVVELTETAVVQDEAAAAAFIAAVKAAGCGLALDDFGTGYGGFTYLKHLPVDYLKIDVEFVRDLPDNPASQHVVKAVVSLARGFGQKTVAEGVEDERTLTMLREFGVDYAQGYAIARPAPIADYLGALPAVSPASRPVLSAR
jgi:PAS domain S-box-containing protein